MGLRKFLLLFFAVISIQAYSQKTKKFSKDPQTFLPELNNFLLKDLDKKRGEPLYLEFEAVWNAETFSEVGKTEIINISNAFLKKRIIEFENWEYFLKSAMQMATAEKEGIADPWLRYFAQFADKEKSNTIRTYIRTINQLLFDRKFFDDGTLKYEVVGDDFVIDFTNEIIVTVNHVDLWAYYKIDSTVIEKTSGIYYPASQEFIANGGTMYWERAGLSRDSANATLAKYKINISKTQFTADSVRIKTFLFPDEILGVLEERLSTKVGEGTATFPRFYSYNNNVNQKNLYPEVDYIGGFSLIGGSFFASGSKNDKAKMIFKYQDKPLIIAQANRFLLKGGLVSSQETRVTVFVDQDSIYHPKVNLKFRPDQGTLSFNRENKGIAQTPFVNTYHNMDIMFEALTWKRGQPKLLISNLNIGAMSPVVFESADYFRNERFEAITGLADRSPLYNVRDVTNALGRNTVSLEEMAQFLRMSKEAAHRFMLQMVVMSFVNYNQEKEEITVKDRLYNYIENYEQKRDFDVIRFVSTMESGANATISLENYDLEINGIQRIALSDSQDVALYPATKKITVHKDLNFDFNGTIAAGRFLFWGKDFVFDYNQFQLNMATIDSMRFKVESFTADMNGNRKLIDVKNTLQNINGELLIDKPNNKSGQIRYTEYPIFRSGRESYVYYDRNETYGGVYNRDKFYVELEPFEIDSLDNTSTTGLQFAGTFNSAGIFPDIKENLLVQEDYSLGFKTATPAGGSPAYGGKGIYEGSLLLSNDGFRGKGHIDYLTADAYSEQFVFFPDSTNGVAYEYEIAEQKGGADYPHVTGNNVWVNWQPKKDVFYTRSLETPFNMYDDVGMKATGTLAYGPTKLAGNARVDFLDAQADSRDFRFQNRKFNADSLDFRVRANETKPWGFELANAKGFVDFNLEKGEFTKNDPAGYLSFPINEYIGLMDFAEWSIPAKSIEVEKLGGTAAARMISVNKGQDSLQYNAVSSKFYLEDDLLESFKVPYIDVADARIFPDSGYVAIDPKAAMRTLRNAEMEANRTTKFHKFFDGSFDIKTRHNYTGSANYEYIDQDLTAWPLYFESIKVDTSETTIGLAKVTKEDEFYLSPYFGYYGEVQLTASEKLMSFKGYTLIQQTCENIETSWFKFESIIDPKQIVIDLPIDNPTTRGDNVYNGIYIAPDSTSGFSAFLTRDNTMADQELFSATGVLFYDVALAQYVVTTPEKVADPKAPGNYLTLDSRTCVTIGKGKLSYSPKEAHIDLTSSGIITHDLASDVINMDIVMAFDFFFSDDILKLIAQDINKSAGAGTDNSREAYDIALSNIFTEKEKAKYDEEVNLYGIPEKVPKPLRKTILFSQLNLVWNQETNSFVSQGSIGVGSILDMQVNRQVEGIVEIVRKSRGDEVYIYLELESGYHYIQYKRNQLQYYSSNKDIMEVFRGIDPKKRSIDAKDGVPPYKYNPSTKGKANLFLSKFE